MDRLAQDRNAFDALRLLAALAVLYSHSFPIFGLPEPQIFGDTLGKAAVGVFFAISGCLVCRSWEQDQNAWRFSQRRALRILPGLVVSVVLTTVLIGTLFSTLSWDAFLLDSATWASIRSNATLISDVDRIPGLFEEGATPVFNGSLWTLRYEVVMYAALVLIAMSGQLRLLAPFIFVLASTSLVAAIAAGVSHYSVPLPGIWRTGLQFDGLRLARLAAYFFGAATLYLHRDRIPLRWSWCALLAGAVFWVPAGALTAALVCVALPYVTMVAAMRSPSPLRFPLHTDLSYGLYLYAYPIQQACTAVAHKHGWPWLSTLALSALITAAFAWLSWLLVERPALKLKPRGTLTASRSVTTEPKPVGSRGPLSP